MKQKFFLAIILVIAYSFSIKTFDYTISNLDPVKGTVKVTMEKSTAMIQTKGKTSTTSSTYTISNAKSLVRIRITDNFFQSHDMLNSYLSASDYISLYKLNTGKNSRSFTINTDGTNNAAFIPLNFIPTETRAYTNITAKQGLIAGEYAFVDRSTTTADGNITVWCFGID